MKNTNILFIFLFLGLNSLFAQTGKYYQHTYTGSLGGKFPILMWLQVGSDGKVTGNYSYKNVGELLSLEGQKQATSLKLTEKDKSGKQTGSFSLTFAGENLAGKWTSADGSKNFDLSLNRIGKETISMEKLHYEAKSSRMEGEEEITCAFNIDVIKLAAKNDPSVLMNYTMEKLEQKCGGSGQKSSNWKAGTIECSDVNSDATMTMSAIQVGNLLNVDISTWEMAGGAHGYANSYTSIVDLATGLEVVGLEGNFKAEKITELCQFLDKALLKEMKNGLEADCLTGEEAVSAVYEGLQNGKGSSPKDWEGALGISAYGVSFTRNFDVSYAAQVCGSVTINLSFKELAPYIAEDGLFTDFK